VVTDIDVTSITQTSATVSWTDSSAVADGYVVDVYEAGADISAATVIFTETVAAGVTTVDVTNLAANSEYDVYVTSDCGKDKIAVSQVKTFTTEEYVCDAVVDLEITEVTAGEASLSWTASATAIEGYTIYVYETGADISVETPVFSKTVAFDVTVIKITDLKPLTSYDVFITSDCGEKTAISDVAVFITDDIASVNEFNLTGIKLSPNPTSADLNISATKAIEEVQVYNVL